MVKVQRNSQGKVYVANNKALLAKELGTKSITTNGTYAASSDSLDGYSSVTVNVSGGSAPAGYIPRAVENGVLKVPSTSFTYSVPAGTTTIGANILQNAFAHSGLTAINLGSVTTIRDYGCQGMCELTNITSIDLSHITSIGANGLEFAFNNCRNLTGSIDLSGLTAVDMESMSHAFYHSAITSLDMSNVTSIDSNGMYACCISCNLSSVNFSSLENIGDMGLSSAFNNNTSLTSADLSTVKHVGAEGFSGAFSFCSNLVSVDVSGIEVIYESSLFSAFSNTSVQSLSFNSLTSTNLDNGDFDDDPSLPDFFRDMLLGVTGCTVHFPSNLQAVIGSWDDVVGGFGGTNTTVLFDLPATS